MERVEALERLGGLGFSDEAAQTLADHFLDADRRGKPSHGVARIEWLETFPGLDPPPVPSRRPRHRASTSGKAAARSGT